MHASNEAQGGALTVKVGEYGSTHTLELTGELELATVPVLRERLDTATEAGAEVIVLDMTGLEFIDSTGIALLIDVDNRLNDGEGSRFLLIASEAPAVARVMKLTELETRLRFIDRPPTP